MGWCNRWLSPLLKLFPASGTQYFKNQYYSIRGLLSTRRSSNARRSTKVSERKGSSGYREFVDSNKAERGTIELVPSQKS